MRKAFTGRRRSFRSAKKGRDRAWFATLVDGNQPLSTFSASTILDTADYQQGNLQPTALLETIYLELAVGPVAAAAQAVNWAVFGLLVIDKDFLAVAAQNDPDSAANLTAERWLWTQRMFVPTAPAGPMSFSIHVKQRVRLKDMDVRFVSSNSDPTTGFDYSFHSRCLVRY